jgi:hypothetical protein
MGRYHYFQISTLPRLHHIVWCRVPDANGTPGQTVRPALIRGSKHDPTTGRGALLVSYGSKSLQLQKLGHLDLIIQNNTRMRQLGLPTATRFDLGLTNWLPWADEFFASPAHSVQIVAGPLSENERIRLRSRLKARGIITAL